MCLFSFIQCCIDDDLNMLKVVVKHGGNVNGTDYEGWTPLHAATSCGYAHIVKYVKIKIQRQFVQFVKQDSM